ncbi:hypothetical protein F4805DRAFT_216679 [Annulohypoxylon moriforme]|nr:hypothetical protein F4805DRAFT_216679 [Annulohypoxylon moriforme]
MSGFEIAGVVLGAIPLIISALEYYKKGKKSAKSIRKWNSQVDMLIEQLEIQKMFFHIHILQLLQRAGVEEVINTGDISQDRCVSILRSMKNGTEVKEYFGPFHGRFLKILKRYEDCFKTIISKLKYINRPQNAAEDDLAAILDANELKAGAFAFKERVKFTIEKGSLTELIEELRQDRLSLRDIVECMETQSKYIAKQPMHDAMRLANIFAQVHTDAMPLFAAVCGVCTCECSGSHSVLMRLDSRAFSREEGSILPGNIKERTTFNLVFDFDNHLHEALVKTVKAEESQAGHVGASNQGATIKTPAARVQTIINSAQANSNVNQTTLTKVTNICDHIYRTRASGHMLKLQLTNNDLCFLNGLPESQRDFSNSMTLEKFLQVGALDRSAQMTPKQKTLLALEIAASIPQLRQTCWSSPPFNTKGIKFPVQLEGDMAKVVLEPLVERAIKESLTQGDGLGDTDPNTTLLELVVLLLETWNGELMNDWMARFGITSTDSEEGRRMATVAWVNQIHHSLPPYYLDVIDYCIGICGGRKRVWHDDKFLTEYCQNVIMPLHDGCKTWLPSGWYQTLIMYKACT